MKRAAPVPQDPISNLEAMVFALQTQLAFAMRQNTELEFTVENLRRLVVSEPPREWLTVTEAAELCGWSCQAVRKWCRRNDIGIWKGCGWQVDRAKLIAFLINRFGRDQLPAGLRLDR